MYILHQQHIHLSVSGSQPAYFVSSGNLLVASVDLDPSQMVVGISSCTPSNTWTNKTQGMLWPTFLYVAGGSFSTSMKCTITTSGGCNNGIVVFYDVVGAAAEAPIWITTRTGTTIDPLRAK